MRSAIAIVACVASLGLVNYSIAQKERLLASGAVVFLELAPVDPRSLMQGDYMALRFAIADQISTDSSGSAALRVDPRGVATLDPDSPSGATRNSPKRAAS